MNFELLKAIKEAGMWQKDFARIVQDHPSIVSEIISGKRNPDEKRKVKYARVLGKKIDELFDN